MSIFMFQNNMGKPKKTWKSVELNIAKLFGANRVPLSGSNSGHNTSSDILWSIGSKYEHCFVEIKHGEQCNKKYGIHKLMKDTMLPNNAILTSLVEILTKDWILDSEYEWKKKRAYFDMIELNPMSKALSLLCNDTISKAIKEGKRFAIIILHPLGVEFEQSYAIVADTREYEAWKANKELQA